MAGAAATGLDLNQRAMWRALLAADYFAIPVGQCHTCRIKKKKVCGQFFCSVCNVGNVCKATFRNNGEHVHPQRPHPHHQDASIRVWKVTDCFCLDIEDVGRFIPPHIAGRLHLYKLNGRSNAKLARPAPTPANPGDNNNPRRTRPICTGPNCGNVLSVRVSSPNHSTHPVCSIQCLLDDLDRARAGVAVPVPRSVRVHHFALARPVARAILVTRDESQGPGQVLDVDGQDGHERVPEVEVQEGHEFFASVRKRPRKESQELIRRSHMGNHDFIPRP